jgi:alpha-N-arabinofuranosidase
MRDAEVAALTLNIFHRHTDRVKLAAIAQMVNVLQAMILTDKTRMVLTPTYYVFDMYKVFQGATNLPIDVQAPVYRYGNAKVPGIHAAAGQDAAGALQVALVNLDPHNATTVHIRLAGPHGTKLQGKVLTAPAITSINTFTRPHEVEPVPFEHASLKGDAITADLPAKSVVVLEIR